MLAELKKETKRSSLWVAVAGKKHCCCLKLTLLLPEAGATVPEVCKGKREGFFLFRVRDL